mgnify:CR=1 FL=1
MWLNYGWDMIHPSWPLFPILVHIRYTMRYIAISHTAGLSRFWRRSIWCSIACVGLSAAHMHVPMKYISYLEKILLPPTPGNRHDHTTTPITPSVEEFHFISSNNSVASFFGTTILFLLYNVKNFFPAGAGVKFSKPYYVRTSDQN